MLAFLYLVMCSKFIYRQPTFYIRHHLEILGRFSRGMSAIVVLDQCERSRSRRALCNRSSPDPLSALLLAGLEMLARVCT